MRTVLIILGALATAAAPLARAADTGFAGIVEMAETIAGGRVEEQDRTEFDRYAQVTDTRLKKSRADLATAPPVVAQTLREDVGFYQAELERIAAASGRELVLSTVTYRLSRGRIVVETPIKRYRIDRNRGTAQVLAPDGAVADAEPAAMPKVDDSGGETGPVLLGLPTRQFTRTIAGRQWTLCMAPDLPNVCALAAISGETDDELSLGIASLPGMPLRIETRDGTVVRRLEAVRIVPRELPDETFTPWK